VGSDVVDDLLVQEVVGREARVLDRIPLGEQLQGYGVARLVLDADYAGIGQTVMVDSRHPTFVCYGSDSLASCALSSGWPWRSLSTPVRSWLHGSLPATAWAWCC
jgi:hypothetical protein